MVHIIVIGKCEAMCEFCGAIQNALKTKGYNSTISYYNWYKNRGDINKNIVYSPDINIIINLQHVNNQEILPKNKSIKILILPEQRIENSKFSQWDKVFTLFKNLSTKKIQYLPIGYSSIFNNPSGKKGDGYDIFSFGALTPYRKEIVNKYKATHIINSIWGNDRDIAIRNSKFNINLKARSNSYYFAPIHAMLIICKGVTLFQEKCDGDYSLYDQYMIQFDSNNFNKIKEEWMDDNKRLSFGIDARKKIMSNLDFTYEFVKCLDNII